MESHATRPASVTAAFILVLLNALLWLAFGLIVALGLHPALPAKAAIWWAYTLLPIGCSAALAGLGFSLVRRSPTGLKKIAFPLLAGLLALIAVFILLDEFGPADLLVLLLTLAPLGLLLATRRWYLQPRN